MASIPTATTTADQAWAILRRHARDEVSHLRLRELCRSDERVSALVSVYNATTPTSNGGVVVDDDDINNNNSNRMIIVDMSRQFLTLETLNKLLYLSTVRGIPKRIRSLAWGPYSSSKIADALTSTKPAASPSTSLSSPSYYLSLRAPEGKGLRMLDRDGRTNVLTSIHNDWDRIRRFSESIRRGQLSGVNGQMIRDVIVVGKGTPIMMLRFVYLALCKDMDATVARRVGMNNTPQRRIKFLTTCDPIRAAAVVADSDPGATIVVTLSVSSWSTTKSETANIGVAGDGNSSTGFSNDEIGIASRTLQTWLISHLGQNGRRPVESILKKHMMWVVTTLSSGEGVSSPSLSSQHRPETTFQIPSHSQAEPFTSFTAASLLPLSIVFGWSIVEQFLAGAHDMDRHFVETNPRHNLPVLLALTDVWNDTCFPDGTAETGPLLGKNRGNGNMYGGGAAGRVITPFTEAFAAYPAFVATLESQACGRSVVTSLSSSTQIFSSIVIDGGLHGMYDRSAFESSKVLPSELVMTLDPQLPLNSDPNLGIREVNHAQDALICSLFAHADELAFGSQSGIKKTSSLSENAHPLAAALISSDSDATKDFAAHQSSQADHLDGHLSNRRSGGSGNRPSTLLLCDKLDAFACGQLVAMAEHRVLVKAWIWDINPFIMEPGASMRSKRLDSLQASLQRMIIAGPEYEGDGDFEKEEEGMDVDLNLSTRTILRHYAKTVAVPRMNQVKK